MSLKPVRARAPRIQLRPGRMTSVLEALKEKYPDKFGNIKRVTEIPDDLIPLYVEALVDKYGYATAKRMIMIQIIFRKRTRDPDKLRAKRKFEAMLEWIDKVKAY